MEFIVHGTETYRKFCSACDSVRTQQPSRPQAICCWDGHYQDPAIGDSRKMMNKE